MATTTKGAAAKARRFNPLRTVLGRRRAELVHDLGLEIRSIRSGGNSDRHVLDAAETSEVDIQSDIGMALIQLKAETLKNIDAALRRIEEGTYGNCLECGAEIAEARLSALPFAVRCRQCEQLREAADERERSLARRGTSPFLLDMGS